MADHDHSARPGIGSTAGVNSPMTHRRTPLPLNHMGVNMEQEARENFRSVFSEGDPDKPHAFGEEHIAATHMALVAHQNHLLERIAREAFNANHPVDEYLSSQGATVNPMELTANYKIPARICSYLITLPAGTTGAVMQLGDRYIQIYGGPALQLPTTFTGADLGIILGGEDDARFLTITPQPVSGPCHFEIMGWADEYYG